MQIGEYKLKGNLFAAPMAGVSDMPFRQLCEQQGASLTVGEMVLANPKVWYSDKTQQRSIANSRSTQPKVVQIAGSDPDWMAQTAQFQASLGANIIDINMGCPAKKVNKKLAGSALLQYPELVQSILTAVVEAVSIPVTLKIRTGWDQQHKNGLEIAQIAEQCGIQSLAIHGRTKACGFSGQAEYNTIRRIKQMVTIPVLANGDINSPEKAVQVLTETQADGLMLGRAALGQPWLFRQVQEFITTGKIHESPHSSSLTVLILEHIQHIHQFYGVEKGVRIARKHIAWYLQHQQLPRSDWRAINQLNSSTDQLCALTDYLERHLH